MTAVRNDYLHRCTLGVFEVTPSAISEHLQDASNQHAYACIHRLILFSCPFFHFLFYQPKRDIHVSIRRRSIRQSFSSRSYGIISTLASITAGEQCPS
jgi:hypothetical protein